MKKIIAIAFSIFALACSNNEYKVNGEINELANGTKVYLEKQDPEKGTVIIVDSAKIENGKYTFEGKIDEPEIHSIRFEKTPGNFILFLENGNISVKSNKDSIIATKISGTFNNEEFMKYNNAMNAFRKKVLPDINKNMLDLQKASRDKDTANFIRISKENEKIQQAFINESYKYVENSPKSFLSVLLVEGMFNEMQPKIDKIRKYFDALDSSIKETKPGKRIKEKLDKIGVVAIGSIAPDFTAKTPEGKSMSLKESLGKVTIVDFWASWCGPCRKENPHVVSLYNEFHSKGLNIIGVSLDKESSSWTEAIKKDNLTWNHVSNLKYWDEPIAKTYNVQSIPSTFILDSNGKIVAKNLQGEELRSKI